MFARRIGRYFSRDFEEQVFVMFIFWGRIRSVEFKFFVILMSFLIIFKSSVEFFSNSYIFANKEHCKASKTHAMVAKT